MVTKKKQAVLIDGNASLETEMKKKWMKNDSKARSNIILPVSLTELK